MKKLVKFLMLGMVSASLIAGCGGNSNTNTTSNSTQENSQANTETEVQVEYSTGELMTPADAFAGGDGSKESPYEISTAEELYRMASVIKAGEDDADKKYYILTHDITINDVSNYANWETEAPQYGWEPIKAFKGNLNGNGHSITGLYCFVSGENALVSGGLFDDVSGGIIENLNLDQAMVIRLTSASYAGILAGSISEGEIRNCQVSGVVIGPGSGCGGVVGHAYWSVIDTCSFSGEVRGEKGGSYGGIIGTASGCAVSNCSNRGTITTKDEKDSNAGGIVGSFSASAMGFSLDEETYPEMVAATEAFIEYVKGHGVGIKNSMNQGEVYAKKGCAGGIVGDISDGLGHEYRDVVVIEGCMNEGNVSAEGTALYSAGGICGWYATSPATWEEQTVTGAVRFENCMNSGIITTSGANAAGILGGANIKKGTLIFENCTCTGLIVAELEEVGGFNTVAGGIAGTISIFEESELRFENCLAESEMRTKKVTFVGGILGSITVAESNDGELTCILRNCQSNGELTTDEYATCGSICGSFMKGVKKDDFAGTVEVENCTSSSDIPEFGTAGSIVDYIEAYKEAVEKEMEE